MKIKLKDSIISELTCIGLKPGMIISGDDVNKTTGAVHFTHHYKSSSHNCVVWPEDYEIVEENAISDWVNEISKDIPNQITLPISELTNALDAMYWCFSPFLENSDLSEFPWILNLIKSYNSIVSILPSPFDLQYETVEIC